MKNNTKIISDYFTTINVMNSDDTKDYIKKFNLPLGISKVRARVRAAATDCMAISPSAYICRLSTGFDMLIEYKGNNYRSVMFKPKHKNADITILCTIYNSTLYDTAANLNAKYRKLNTTFMIGVLQSVVMPPAPSEEQPIRGLGYPHPGIKGMVAVKCESIKTFKCTIFPLFGEDNKEYDVEVKLYDGVIILASLIGDESFNVKSPTLQTIESMLDIMRGIGRIKAETLMEDVKGVLNAGIYTTVFEDKKSGGPLVSMTYRDYYEHKYGVKGKVISRKAVNFGASMQPDVYSVAIMIPYDLKEIK